MPKDTYSVMPSINGNTPAVDANNFITDIAYKRPVVAVTIAARTVKVSESGTYFTTQGTGTDVNFTLPAVSTSAGCEYWFAADGTTYTLTVTSAPADKMVTDGDIAADSAAIATAAKIIGNTFHVWSNGSLWMTCVEVGKVVAGGVIVTVAS